VRDWTSGDRAGTTVEIDADALGHDLAWGTTVYTRSVASTLAHDADLPSDRAAVLEDGDAGSGEAETSVVESDTAPDADTDAGEPGDDLAAARSKRPLEAALPF